MNNVTKSIVFFVSALVLLGGVIFVVSRQKSAPTTLGEQTQTITPTMAPQKKVAPKIAIDPKKSYAAILHTDKGDITLELTADETPITVNNFVTLARNKFYDNVIFHRVIKGFMIQGGDPDGNGTGGPGYKFDDEPFEGEYIRGTVAMANAGPDTNGSQFFIVHQDSPQLPKDYVIFGKVTEGIEVVDEIAQAPTKPEGEGSSPVKPVVIESIEITEQ